MKLYHRLIYFLFLALIVALAVYSYVLIDPNLFVSSVRLENIREQFINFGYHQRETSSQIYIGLVVFTLGLHFYFLKHFKRFSIWAIVIPLSLLGIFSYSFLSHDLFNYMFDAKILTFYKQNPYLYKALDFPSDHWLRFMRWTHRNYPYGPSFLPITLIPSWLGLGKFFLSFFLFKGMFAGFYLWAVYCLNKMNRKWAVFFATNPLVIFEGLINAHNDLIALSLGIIGIYFLNKNKVLPRILFLLSAGIKYSTLPLLLLVKDKKSILNKIALVLFIGILVYLSFWQEIQPWYFLTILVLLPFYERFIQRASIFFSGLLFSYYPYVRFGEGSYANQIVLKHQVILIFFVFNVVYYFFSLFKESKK